VRERLDAGFGYVWVDVEIQTGIELVIGLIPKSPTNGEIVNQRIVLFTIVTEIGRQVVFGIEERMRRAKFFSAVKNVMFQGIYALAVDRGVLLQVPFGIEERMRIATLNSSEFKIVSQGVYFRAQVWVLFQIPGGIKERMRVAIFAPTNVKVMQDRIDFDAGDIVVLRKIPGRIEERVRAAPVVAAPPQIMLKRV
jgi:hypothetical protein